MADQNNKKEKEKNKQGKKKVQKEEEKKNVKKEKVTPLDEKNQFGGNIVEHDSGKESYLLRKPRSILKSSPRRSLKKNAPGKKKEVKKDLKKSVKFANVTIFTSSEDENESLAESVLAAKKRVFEGNESSDDSCSTEMNSESEFMGMDLIEIGPDDMEIEITEQNQMDAKHGDELYEVNRESSDEVEASQEETDKDSKSNLEEN